MAKGRRNLPDIDDNKTLSRSNIVIFCKVLLNSGDSTEFVIAILTGRAAVQKDRRIKRNYAGNDVVAARNTLEPKRMTASSVSGYRFKFFGVDYLLPLGLPVLW